jgi:hypothetical protein
MATELAMPWSTSRLTIGKVRTTGPQPALRKKNTWFFGVERIAHFRTSLAPMHRHTARMAG